MDTTVQSFLRIKNEFVPLREFKGKLPDEYYIAGAICCRIGDRDILTFEHWDLVDQLWAYILEGLKDLTSGRAYDAYFPDQPLRLRFMPVSARSVDVSVGDRSFRLDTSLFVSAMQRGAVEFFTAMKTIHPNWSQRWDRYVQEALSLPVKSHGLSDQLGRSIS